MKSYRALIVDDEPLGRARLEQLLEPVDWIEAETCASGCEAIARLNAERFDIAFLDILMPEADGFVVAEAAQGNGRPLIVFVTAFDQYAVRAFEACALDYLLKPYDRKRFDQTLDRLRERLSLRTSGAGGPPPKPKTFIIRSKGHVRVVLAADIDWIEAAGNYAALHCNGEEWLYRAPLAAIENDLEGRFVRTHRGALVNRAAIRSYRPKGRGDGEVELHTGETIRVSRRFGKDVRALFAE